MAVEFISVNRNTPHLFPPCVEDHLPEDHLARFVVDMVERLDVSPLVAVYEGRGSKPYHPRMMLGVVVLRLRHRHVFEPQVGEGDV